MSDFGNYYGSFQAAKEWDEKGDGRWVSEISGTSIQLQCLVVVIGC